MGLSLIVLILAVFLLLALTAAAALLLVLLLPRAKRRPYEPDDGPSPLARAQSAAAALNTADWEAFRRWLEGERTFPPPRGEGVTR